MSAKIHCPNCGRILGDTQKSLDGVRLNCRGCKNTVDIYLELAKADDLLSKIYKIKEETRNDDKS